jgi:hypothetical protein
MRNFLTWLIYAGLTFVCLWSGSVGWYQVACAQGLSDAWGWGLLALLLSPFSMPPIGIAAVLIMVFAPFGMVARIRSANHFGRTVLWAALAAASAFLLLNVVARATSAHARCSLGF